MFSDVNACLVLLVVRLSLSARVSPGGWYLHCSAEASVASRSGTMQIPTVANLARAQSTICCEYLIKALISFAPCLSCTGKKLRPMLLRKEYLAARASSCNPRTAFSQSEAQPEPRTPC